MTTKYPKHIEERSGCKVSWLIFDNLADAERASLIAELEAIELAQQGFDFGFCCPGKITKTAKNRFEVVVP